MKREVDAQGYRCLEQEVISHIGKRRDIKEGWMKRRCEPHLRPTLTEKVLTQPREENKQRNKWNNRDGLGHSNDSVNQRLMGKELSFQ